MEPVMQETIPKTIHYCWFGPAQMSRLHRACLQTWELEMPGYEIVRWDESNAPMAHPFVAFHYRKKHWAYVSDFVRLHVLYEHGGIYLDTDVEVIRDFDPLRRHRVFLGYEKAGRITSGVCGAMKGERFLNDCMEFMQQRHRKKLPYRIAPEVMTAVYGAGDYDEVALMPEAAFYPYNPYGGRGAGQFMYHDVTDATYAVHHWAKSWKMPWWERVLRKVL